MKLTEAVAELNPLDDLRQAVLTVEFAPFPLRRHHQLEGHGQPGPATEATFGALGAVPNGREGAFNWVRCPDVFPVLGRVVVKGQKRLAILDQLGNGLVVFDAVGFDEEIESSAGPGLGFRLPDVMEMTLGSNAGRGRIVS